MNVHSRGVIYLFVAAAALMSTGRASAKELVKVCVQVIQKEVRPKPDEAKETEKKASGTAPKATASVPTSPSSHPKTDKTTPASDGEREADDLSMGPPKASDEEGPSKETGGSPPPVTGVAGAPPAGLGQGGGAGGFGLPSVSDEENWDRVIRDRRKSLVYIKRLLEYYVTHDPGFEAVDDGCRETITVELYPITEGWTAFARFSKNGREERVDNLTQDEISQFAERSVLALLHDVPISETIARDTVLKSDSKKARQKIRGNSHFTMAVGTQIRGGYFDTAITDRGDPNVGGVEKKVRVAAPLKAAMAYRGRFETWGIENRLNLMIGTEKKAPSKNPQGGHADFSVGTGLSLHVFRYAAPRGLTSFYYGAGGTFELLWFSAVNAAGASESRSRLVSGGLDVDGVLGVEFMRASSVQFYIQGELNLPAYMVSRENTYALIHTWFPGATVELGIMF